MISLFMEFIATISIMGLVCLFILIALICMIKDRWGGFFISLGLSVGGMILGLATLGLTRLI